MTLLTFLPPLFGSFRRGGGQSAQRVDFKAKITHMFKFRLKIGKILQIQPVFMGNCTFLFL